MQSHTRSPMELWERIQVTLLLHKGEWMVVRAESRNRLNPPPRCDQPSQG